MALTATPADQALLLDVQQFDTKLAQLAARAKKLPEAEALLAVRADRDRVVGMLTRLSGEWEDAQTEVTRTETDVALVDARIARDQQRLATTSSVKDVQALEQELAALARRKSDLEDIELAVMETAENAERSLEATRAQVADLDAREKEAVEARDAALAAIADEQKHAAANRATIAGKVPADLLALYEKQRDRYGAGASLLRGGVSTATGVMLTTVDMNTVRRAAPDEVLICPESQAILIRTDESGL